MAYDAAGFTNIEVDDKTEACLGGFRRSLKRWPRAERAAGRLRLGDMIAATASPACLAGYFGATTKAYLLVNAQKTEVTRNADQKTVVTADRAALRRLGRRVDFRYRPQPAKVLWLTAQSTRLAPLGHSSTRR